MPQATEPRAGRRPGPRRAPRVRGRPLAVPVRLRHPALLLALSGCLATQPPAEPVPAAPPFRPEVFFDGHTRGHGSLQILGRGSQRVEVESHGEAQPDGTFRLDQTITRGDATTTRTWLLRPTSPTTYTGTLTDASGAVAAEVDGSVLHIRYGMGAGLTMRQQLVLQPGGAVVLNRSTVRLFGVPIAQLAEQIRRLPPRP